MPKAQQLRYGCVLDCDYPMPIVDISRATREAKAKIVLARKKDDIQTETQAIIKKHASRKGMLGGQRDENGQQLTQNNRQKKSTLNPNKSNQKELF